MINLEKRYNGPVLKSYAYDGKAAVKFASIGLFTDKEVSEQLNNVLKNKIETQFNSLVELRRELYEKVAKYQVLINNENIKTLLAKEEEGFIYLKGFIEALRVNDNSTSSKIVKERKRRRIMLMQKTIEYNDLAIQYISEVHDDVTRLLIKILLFWKDDILPKIKTLCDCFPSTNLETSIFNLLKYCFSGRDDYQELINEYQDSYEYPINDSDILLFYYWSRIKDEFNAISYEDCEDELIGIKCDDELVGDYYSFYESKREVLKREVSALLKERRYELIDRYVIRPYVKMLVFLLLSKNDFEGQSLLLRTIISTFICANEDALNNYNPILPANWIFAILKNNHEIAKIFLSSLHSCGELTIEEHDKFCIALETGDLELIMSVLWAEKRARIIIERFEQFFLLAGLVNRRVKGDEAVSEDNITNILEDSFKSVFKFETDKVNYKTKYLAIVTIHNALINSKVLKTEEANALSCIVTANSNCIEEYQVMLRMAKIMLITNPKKNEEMLPTDDKSNDTDIANTITTKKEKDNIKCSIDTPFISHYDVDKLVRLLTTYNEYTDRAFVTIDSSGTHDVQTCLKYFFNSSLEEFITCKDALQFTLHWERSNVVSLKLLIRMLMSYEKIAKNEVVDVTKYDGISEKVGKQIGDNFWGPVTQVFKCETIKQAKLGTGKSRGDYIKDLETIVEIVYASKRNKE